MVLQLLLQNYNKNINNIKQIIKDPIIWIDLEMTGLNPDTDQIIEIAVLITNGSLDQVIEGPNIIINCEQKILNKMDQWCVQHHGSSGLTQQSINSQIKLQQAESLVMDFILKYVPTPKQAVLAGNSVHMDKYFLIKHMPKLIDHLHYRIIDVSSIKQIIKMWYNGNPPYKKLNHRAMDDIYESLEELKYYKQNHFIK